MRLQIQVIFAVQKFKIIQVFFPRHLSKNAQLLFQWLTALLMLNYIDNKESKKVGIRCEQNTKKKMFRFIN